MTPIDKRFGQHYCGEGKTSVLRGVEKISLGFAGLEKRAENFVLVNNPQQSIFDTLENGVLAIIPICEANFSRKWQQGLSYDLLVVADTPETYTRLNIRTGGVRTKLFHHEASIKDITQATNFLGICIKALAEILASDSNMLLLPMKNSSMQVTMRKQ
jgi:hypothetical protein